jgi:putative DNA methylase
VADLPRVLIEDWLPVAELGIESRRESAPIPGQFPKLKTLHVWWARRPLAASVGAVLGSLMPTWSADLARAFPGEPQLQTQAAYRRWFLRLCGVLGDPVAAKARATANKDKGIRTAANPYSYKPSFKNRLSTHDLGLVQRVLMSAWKEPPTVLDPTAGGGSLPFEAMRMGLVTAANDLNPVSAAVLEASLSLPAVYGGSLRGSLAKFGQVLVERTTGRLNVFFPEKAGEKVTNYIFARTVACPRTGKLVPMSPNWWLSHGDKPTAVRIITRRDGQLLDRVEYEIVTGADIDFDPDQGTVAGGDAISPWDGLAIDGEYIREEAQAGRLGSELYAVAVRTIAGRGFRAPAQVDLDGLTAAERELATLLDDWLGAGILPTEAVPDGLKTAEPRNHGMAFWRDMFSPRQLLVHGTFVDEFRKLVPEVRAALPADRASAVLMLLALMQTKALNYNSRFSIWHATRETMANTFDTHNFAFKSTHGEFEGARELYPWCLSQVVGAYDEIAELMRPADVGPLADELPWPVPGPVTVTCRNAADLSSIGDQSIALVAIDPPYYNNVMYAELSDFFYVWEKRTLGLIKPELFSSELTDKKNEAVANVSRFADAGRRRNELANADYEAKMGAIFVECARVLRDDGVLTVMFTHKRAEAWDTLGMGLLKAGFRIETSWPVNTESEQSLHQAKKNAAASTIFLVCRKRQVTTGSPPFFEDIEGDVRAAVRQAVERFALAGLSGVDLLLSTYGPALSVISAHWPVYSSEADPITGRSRLLRPEEALDAGRSEVVRLQRRRLVGTDVQFDALTDFELIAWETFKAAEFPYDEARRLALATGGLDVDALAKAKILEKKAGTVVLLSPEKRVRRAGDDQLPGVRPDETSFPIVIDAVHTVMYVAATDGLPAARALIDRAGLGSDPRFLSCLQGLVNAIPRTRTSKGWARKEAETLDHLCAAYFPSIVMPLEFGMNEQAELWS